MLDNSDQLNIYNKNLSEDNGVNFESAQTDGTSKKKPPIVLIILVLIFLVILGLFYFTQGDFSKLMPSAASNSIAQGGSNNMEQEADEFFNQVTSGENSANPTSPGDTVDIDVDMQAPASTQDKSKNKAEPKARPAEKTIDIPVERVSRANPFLPYVNSKSDKVAYDYELLPPPENIIEQPEAVEMMKTTVSGIMYDKIRPSAIININGNDQLVHKGDKIASYNIIDITRDRVVVKTGSNIFRAAVGQTLGDGTLNFNGVSNLSKQFGGSYNKSRSRVLEITSD